MIVEGSSASRLKLKDVRCLAALYDYLALSTRDGVC